MTKVFLAALIVSMSCASAPASVGLEPASGYVHLPDAQVVGAGGIEGFAAYVTAHGTNELSRLSAPIPCDGNGFTLGAVGGLGKNAELGVSYLSIDKSSGNANAFTAAAKWRFVDRADSGLGVAIGASYRTWNSSMRVAGDMTEIGLELPEVWSVYLVADKTYKPCAGSVKSVAGTIGVAYDSFSSAQQSYDVIAPWGPNIPIGYDGIVWGDSFVSPFVAARAAFTKWSVLGEFRPRLETDGFSYQSTLWSLAVSAKFSEATSATAGVSTMNLPYTRSDPAFFFEITHRFGK